MQCTKFVCWLETSKLETNLSGREPSAARGCLVAGFVIAACKAPVGWQSLPAGAATTDTGRSTEVLKVQLMGQ